MSTLKTIPRKVWWGLEAKSYTEIAQEPPSQNDSLRKWIAIYAVYHLNFKNRYPNQKGTDLFFNQKGTDLFFVK